MKILHLNNINEISLLNRSILNKYRLFVIDLEIQSILKRKNIKFLNTNNFFSKNDHKKVVSNTDKILKNLLINLKNNYQINKFFSDYGFYLNFKFRIRGYISKLIINNCILKNLIKKYYKIYYFQNNKIKKFNYKIEDKIFCYENHKNSNKKNLLINFFLRLRNLFLVFYLNFFNKKKIILINETSYNLPEKIIHLLKKYKKNYYIVSVNSTLNEYSQYRKNYKYFSSFFLNYNFSKIKNSKLSKLMDFSKRLLIKNFLKYENFKLDIYKLNEIFSSIYYNLNQYQHKNNILLKKIRKMKNISLILSQHSLDTGSSLFKASKLNNIPSVCFSHGTYSYTKNKEANLEWAEHSNTMINSNFEYICSNSELMTNFLKKSRKKVDKEKIIKTSPFLFSTNQKHQDKKLSNFFSKKKINKYKKIILHANSPKFGRGVIYDTFDEYIFNINSVIKSIDGSNLLLIISFRPIGKLTFEIFKNLLLKSENYIIATKVPLANLIENSSLVISHSSTVLEEALYAVKPVLLYDPQKKYNHFDSIIFKKIRHKKMIKYLNSQNNLLKTITDLVNININKELKKKLFYKDYNQFIKLIN